MACTDLDNASNHSHLTGMQGAASLCSGTQQSPAASEWHFFCKITACLHEVWGTLCLKVSGFLCVSRNRLLDPFSLIKVGIFSEEKPAGVVKNASRAFWDGRRN